MFWSRSLVSEDMRAWVDACFDWFDDAFPPPAKPILPTRDFFEAPGGTGETVAALVLKDVQRHMQFEGAVELAPLDVLPGEYRIDPGAMSQVAGTWQQLRDISLIRYDPELMNRPVQFINLLAHEVMHARLAGQEDDLPGGAGAHELATDMGCIIAGFGVFQLQAADEAGWSGYLTQPTRAHGLAIFLQRRGFGPDAVAPFLSSRCLRLVRKAFKAL